jgi:hypothetical protein
MVDLATSNPRESGFRLTEHATDMAQQRGIPLSELGDALSNRSFVLTNSKKDPESNRYVMRYKDLRVVWERRGDDIVVLTIFHR